MLMTRRLLVALGVTAAAFTLAAQAADVRLPVPGSGSANKKNAAGVDDVDPKARIEESASQQDRLRRQFEEFKQALLV